MSQNMQMEERKGEEEDNILIEDPGLIFRPICSLGGETNNQQFQERDIVQLLTAYYDRLCLDLKQSFAPPESLVQVAMGGYDPQFMFLMSKNGNSVFDRVKGLLVFNQESTVTKKPISDQAKLTVQYQKETKVQLHHISSIDEEKLEDVIDLGLDFIWKTMHCASIRINLHHYMQDDEKNPGQQKLKGNETLK